MRYVLLLVGLSVTLLGCAIGAPRSGRDPVSGRDGAVPSDASFADDAGHPLADGGTPRDAGATHDAGATRDAATATDAGGGGLDAGTPPTGTDAGSPGFDSGIHILGESCTMPIDVSAGGTFDVDTCPLRNVVASTCGLAAPDAILRGDAPAGGSTYQIHAGPGWIVQQTDSSCTAMTFSCGGPDWGVSGATFGGGWFWAVARQDGTCGVASVTVGRM